MSREAKALKIEALSREVRRLFHRLKAVGDQIHRNDEISTSHRAVLEGLYKIGPQSVPAMARARPVSRQHIQKLVNLLLRLDLVQQVPNPDHKASPIIKLTAKGTQHFERLIKKEKKLIEEMKFPIDLNRISQATETLSQLSGYFESSDWRSFIQKNKTER